MVLVLAAECVPGSCFRLISTLKHSANLHVHHIQGPYSYIHIWRVLSIFCVWSSRCPSSIFHLTLSKFLDACFHTSSLVKCSLDAIAKFPGQGGSRRDGGGRFRIRNDDAIRILILLKALSMSWIIAEICNSSERTYAGGLQDDNSKLHKEKFGTLRLVLASVGWKFLRDGRVQCLPV